jgi:AcrR family transcriptional regulator
MSVMNRTAPAPRMTGEARRQQILAVTKAIVGAEGFHAVSIDRVAREAGITRPVVYTHFGDLTGLLNAMVDTGNQETLAALEAIVPREPAEGRPDELLVAALGRYLEIVRADPVTWRLALMPPESAPPLLGERIARDRANVVRNLAKLVEPSLSGEDGIDPDPELVAHALVAVSEEAARLVLADPERAPVDRILAHARWLFARLA